MELLTIVNRVLRRVLIAVGLIVLAVALCAAYARFVESTWLCVKVVKLAPAPTVRVIHITDIHFAGDTQYLARVVATINGLDADFVCFTGDLVEEAAFLDGALQILARVNKPLYGIPGNHDLWALHSFASIRTTFRKTGGEWLSRDVVLVPAKQVALMTLAVGRDQTPSGYKRILIEHNPETATRPRDQHFDLILSGHTHGGQSGIPFVRTMIGAADFGAYDRGLFQTRCGPLYVNPGIGTFYVNMRFLCRPEVTVIEM